MLIKTTNFIKNKYPDLNFNKDFKFPIKFSKIL